jgi:class 3 adenylate cyclase
MLESARRPFVCAVAAVDLVGYSTLNVSEQLRLRDVFAASLLEAIDHVPPNQRVIVDTGGGAIVSFLDDPQDALVMVVFLHEALQRAYTGEGFEGALRACINLGPIVLSEDVNGRRIVIGEGVDAARLMMRCTDPGEVTVSRSYYDLIAQLSSDHAALFQHGCLRTDEGSSACEVYVVCDCEGALEFLQQWMRG